MASRALVHGFLTLLLALPCLAQRNFDDGFGGQPTPSGSINGSVHQNAGRPVANAQVEVFDLTTHVLVAHTQTQGDGSFWVSSLPRGRYEVVATAGLEQARAQVEVTWAPESVTLNLPGPGAADAGGRDRVSVNQLQAPKKARDAVRKARLALRRGDLEQARQLAERALTLDPQYGEALALRGLVQLQSGHPDSALADLEEAVRCDPDDPASSLLLAVTYNRLQRFEQAQHAADRAMALAPNAWLGYFEMGIAQLGKNDFAGALRQFDKAQALAPQDFPLLHLGKAQAWRGLQKPEEEKVEMEAYQRRAPAPPAATPPPATAAAVPAFVPPDKK